MDLGIEGGNVITGAEVATVAKAGSSLADAVKATLGYSSRQWPNVHEALMELYAVIDDWCTAAEESNRFLHAAFEARAAHDEEMRLYRSGLAQMSEPLPFHLRSGFIERTLADVNQVLTPTAPWVGRWRRSRSRTAARRTLRSMMRIYCPDLLHAFEEAVANRSRWVVEYREGFVSVLEDPQTPEAVLRTMSARLDDSLRALLQVRDQIGRLIAESFPLGV